MDFILLKIVEVKRERYGQEADELTEGETGNFGSKCQSSLGEVVMRVVEVVVMVMVMMSLVFEASMLPSYSYSFRNIRPSIN
jgi:hypothetical protein